MKCQKINYENLIITPEFARLHAHICGDGFLFKVKTNRSKKELIQHPRKNTVRNRFHLGYCNTNAFLLKLFIKDLKIAFNRIGVFIPSKNQVDVQAKWLYYLFKTFGAGKSKEWRIPDKIVSASKEIKIQWLKAFFDDEAYVSKTQKRIVLNIVNYKGLKQIQSLLNNLNIVSRLNGPYYYKKFYSYHLTIYKNNLLTYSNLIGFNHTKKRRILQELVKNMGT
ncbi:hypothetical protein KY347_03115 [Candidatus Woesearchaeota archaeon]|nr:hypothetical protein [Candidatus Woesearchaeota archaeon]